MKHQFPPRRLQLYATKLCFRYIYPNIIYVYLRQHTKIVCIFCSMIASIYIYVTIVASFHQQVLQFRNPRPLCLINARRPSKQPMRMLLAREARPVSAFGGSINEYDFGIRLGFSAYRVFQTKASGLGLV